MGTSSSAPRADPFLQARHLLQHSGRAGRRHGRRAVAPPAQGRRMVPRRQGPDHPGDEDLPLSRPLDVRPGQVPHARGSDEVREKRDPDRAGSAEAARARHRRRRRAEGHRQGRSAPVVNTAAEFAPRARSPIRPNSTPTCSPDAHPNPHARAVAHHGGGQARQMAGEGRRHGEVRRHPRRDRDRQGDDGIRGGRRRHASARSWCPKAPKA
jgi:hypothetical protein